MHEIIQHHQIEHEHEHEHEHEFEQRERRVEYGESTQDLFSSLKPLFVLVLVLVLMLEKLKTGRLLM